MNEQGRSNHRLPLFLEPEEPASTVALDPERLKRAKKSYSTRRVPTSVLSSLLSGPIRPQPGDLVLAEVTEVGYQERIELPNGRRARLFAGDEIIACYGNRYAPDQFEAEVGDDLSDCDLVAAGGIAAQTLSMKEGVLPATKIRPLGLLGDAQAQRVNLRDYRIHSTGMPKTGHTIAVVGTAMNSGKTTTAARLARGLVAAGYKVGAGKLTGTAAGPDIWFMTDAGADPVLDFTDAGYASTYRLNPEEVEDIFFTLTGHIQASDVDVTVLEVADGIYQRESAFLLSSEAFRSNIDRAVFAARDPAGAAAGVERLSSLGLRVAAVSGYLTSSPLLCREAAAATGLPIMTYDDLADPHMATRVNRAVKEESLSTP